MGDGGGETSLQNKKKFVRGWGAEECHLSTGESAHSEAFEFINLSKLPVEVDFKC